jgi:ABC transporter substrate binding protein
MRRRDFIKVVAGSAATWPLTVSAQQPPRKMPRIDWLVPTPQAEQENLEEYRRGMLELGYVEGRTVATTYLYSGGETDRLDNLAATLVTENVDVIVTFSTPGCLAAKRATTIIPIVFAASSDPLSTGIVTSLGHPGGNITGLSVMATDLSAKRLELCPASAGNTSGPQLGDCANIQRLDADPSRSRRCGNRAIPGCFTSEPSRSPYLFNPGRDGIWTFPGRPL